MAQFRSWSQGWEKAGDEAENKRAKMLEAFNTFKQDNPDATAAEFQEYVSNVMGNKPWLRGALPAEEVLNQLGARNEERAAFKRRDDMFARAKEKAGIESSLRTMIEEDMLSYDPKDIESGKAVEDFASNHPEMFSSVGGGEPLFREGMISRYLNMPNYKRKSAKWFNDNQNSLTDFLKNNPTGDAATYAFEQEVPLHLVQGQFDQAKKTYISEQKKKKIDDQRAVMTELRSDKSLQEAFNNASSSSEGRAAIKKAISLYYYGDEDLISQLDPSVIDSLESRLQAQSDESTRTLNEAKRDKLGKDQGSIIEEIKKGNIADVEGRYGKRGAAMSEFGVAAHAVSSYMNDLAEKYVIDYKAMDLLEEVFHQASADSVTKVGELGKRVEAANILPKLRPIQGRESIEAYKNKIRPEAQPAQEWSKDVLSELHDERERINDAITNIDASAIANPTIALQKFKILLRSLQSRYPMGTDGKLTNERGSVMRDITEDVTKDREWRTGGVYASDMFSSNIEPELNKMASGVTQAMDHISFLMNLIEHNLKNPVKGVTGVVQNTEGGGVYPSPPRAPTRTGR
jgi:hypothetical protein